MADSNVHRKIGQEVRIVDDQDSVVSWLHDAVQQEYEQAVGKLGDSVDIEPSTPTRPQIPQFYEEVSPTNTTFSDGSVFDTPEVQQRSWIVDPFCDDIPDTASDDDFASNAKIKTEQTSTRSVEIHLDHKYDVGGLTTLDPATVDANDLIGDIGQLRAIRSAKVVAPIDPNKPRITSITSCMQCVLADLPCSRTTPCCSRCKRNEQGKLCLLHRQKFSDEITGFNAISCTKPVLLKLRGDDDSIWEEKLELAKELEQSWRDAEDRKNWVLPSLDGLGGNSPSQNRRRLQTNFPGEGKGRLTLKELCVTVDA
ncbi:hypothetical protein OPT61_g1656 [Boeremia exigua]|uniref:Uncharacterized protein n=1 Tax=Boeremia exigua TaxID=749465 RepID=A0ACC2IPI2_9PLEO|nr:hypothetical protein OPT61_g1656 [Boeremia exigua]